MKKTSILSMAVLQLFLMAAIPWHASSATVYVSYYGLSPDPVNVKVGEQVSWVDADRNDFLAPYLITFPTIYGFTPCYTYFSVPGSYSYTAESGYGGGTWSGTVNVVADSPPSVGITVPTNNSIFIAPATFAFEADASDPDLNDIWDVEFWVNDTMVDDVYSAPYATTVTNLATGTYALKAVVWDYSSVKATNSIVVKVVNPPPVTMGSCSVAGGNLIFRANGVSAGTTNVLQCSTNLVNWDSIQTNVSDGTPLSFTNATTGRLQFFRIMQLQ